MTAQQTTGRAVTVFGNRVPLCQRNGNACTRVALHRGACTTTGQPRRPGNQSARCLVLSKTSPAPSRAHQLPEEATTMSTTANDPARQGSSTITGKLGAPRPVGRRGNGPTITATNKTLDITEAYPYPVTVPAEGVRQDADGGGDIVEVRVTTTTVHRVSRRAVAEIEANAAAGVRGVSALGQLLTEHDRAHAVEQVTVSARAGEYVAVGGWLYTAQRVADQAVGDLAAVGAPHLHAWWEAREEAESAARVADGFAPLPSVAWHSRPPRRRRPEPALTTSALSGTVEDEPGTEPSTNPYSLRRQPPHEHRDLHRDQPQRRDLHPHVGNDGLHALQQPAR